MKKLLFGLLLFLLAPVFASAANYKVEDFYVEAKIDIAGSMDVKEIMVIKGSFNGYDSDYYYRRSSSDWKGGVVNFEDSAIYDGGSIANLKVGVKKHSGSIDFDTFNENFEMLKKVTRASIGDRGVYTENDTGHNVNVRLYYPIDNERIIVFTSYTITNIAVIHEDVAEVYWNFLSASFPDDINRVRIRLVLPEEDLTNDFRYWAHGNLSGEIEALINSAGNNIGAQVSIDNFKTGNVIDMRMTFDKNIIQVSNFNNHSNVKAFDKILDVEQKRLEIANEQREAIKGKYYAALFGCIFYIVILIVLWIYIYIKFDKEHQSNFKSKYYREFIEDYSVEVIDYLMNKSITPNAMSSSIMNLIYKKNVQVEEISSVKKKKEYKFTLVNKKNMTDTEIYLTEFLFEKVGHENSFTTNDLKKYASGTNTYSKFTTNFETWKSKVVKAGKNHKFFESNGKIKAIGIIYAIVGILMFIFGISASVEIYWLPIVLVLAIAFLLYTLLFTKRTLKGNDHFLKWKAFKNFLNDFSIMNERELPEVVLWERYMVYAVILGVAEKVQKAMNVRIQELDPSMTVYTYSPTWNLYMHMNLSRVINNSIQTAVKESISKAVANSSSSSNGFGGGFSSGGGFGGGGRGGGGGF